MRFSFLDVLLILGIGLSMFLGYKGGFTKKILTLLALIGAIVLSVHLMRPIGEFIQETGLLSEPLCFIVAFTLIILAIMGAVLYVYHRFGKASGSKSGSVVGVLFGLIEGILILSLLLLGLRLLEAPSADAQKDSLLYRPILHAAPKALDLLKPYLPGAGEFRSEVTKILKGVDVNDVLPEPPKK